MKGYNAYLSFNGNCQQAMKFYADCFNGQIVSSETFGQSQGDKAKEADKDRVMHAEFKAEGMHLMASDGPSNYPHTPGNNVHLALDCSSTEEQDRVFNALATNGQVDMPLSDTFWNARFGMVTDQFGIKWMLNYDKT